MLKKSTNPINGALFALLAFAVFSTHDAIIKSLGGGIGVIQIMFFSALFSMPWLSVMVMSDGRAENFRPHKPFALVLRTLLSMGAGGFAFFAFINLPLADVYGLLFTTPLWITIMSVPLLGERVGVFRWVAVLIGFAGVLVMLPMRVDQFSIGHLSAALSAVCSASNSILTRKIGNSERETVMIMLPTLLSLVVLSLLLGFDYNAPSLTELYKFMVIGALVFLAQLFIIHAYQNSPASIIAPMQYSQLIWAIIYGYIFFGETVEARKIIGAGIIITSGLIILYREIKGPNSTIRPASTIRNFRPGITRNWNTPEED